MDTEIEYLITQLEKNRLQLVRGQIAVNKIYRRMLALVHDINKKVKKAR
jgi:hypothetical protein